jgi:hypothetical protein
MRRSGDIQRRKERAQKEEANSERTYRHTPILKLGFATAALLFHESNHGDLYTVCS